LQVDDGSRAKVQSENDPDISQHPEPSGAERLEFLQGAEGKAAQDAGTAEPLHLCFHCCGELVYPLDWSEDGPHHWRVLLRCPECESRREGVFDQGAVEALDDELDRGSSALLGDLRRMTHANMSDEIEFFIRALDADVITPSDF
jgi:hypothetical protein